METGELRQRILRAVDQAKREAVERRAAVDVAASAYTTFLADIAVPLVRQVVSILRADRHEFTAFTPADGARVASDRVPEDFVEIALDQSGAIPRVVVRTSVKRGRGAVFASERVVADGKPIDAITDHDLADAFVAELRTLLVKT